MAAHSFEFHFVADISFASIIAVAPNRAKAQAAADGLTKPEGLIGQDFEKTNVSRRWPTDPFDDSNFVGTLWPHLVRAFDTIKVRRSVCPSPSSRGSVQIST